jgi:BMFP domain-containing protein YqiC
MKNNDQQQIKNDISAIQNNVSTDISAIRSSLAEFEKKIMDKLNRQLKGITTVVKQQTQKLCKEFNSEIQMMR